MSTPNPCGCCCSLKTGGKVIAILDIIGGILTVVIYAAVLVLRISILEVLLEDINHEAGTYRISGKRLITSQENVSKDANKILTIQIYVISAILLINGVVIIIFGAKLFSGVQKKSVHTMKLWIIVRMVILVNITICNIWKYAIDFSGMFLFHDVFSITITLWFIAVVFYLGQELNTQSAQSTLSCKAAAVVRTGNSEL